MFCCTLLYVHSSIAIILMGKRGLVALLGLSSWCIVMVERLFLAVPRGCLQFVIVVFPHHTHLLFLIFKMFSVYDSRSPAMIYIKTSSLHDCQCIESITVMKACIKVTYGDVSKKEL